MTKEETIKVLHKIKAHYQEFALEDYVINEWHEKLEKYEYQDVLERFNKHLNSEFRNRYPRLNYIVAGLKTPEEKAKQEAINIRCSVCNEIIPYLKYDKHIARHNSIAYIKSREHYLNKTYNEEKMMNASEEEFNKFYDKVIERLYCTMEDSEEKMRLERIMI